MKSLSTLIAASLGLGVLSVESLAGANGAFPTSGQILVDPSDAQTMWISTTYGYAKSSDAGATFHLICEDAIGYSSGFHPHAAISQTGAIFMGLSDGMAIGRGSTCAFDRAPDVEGSFVVDVSMSPQGRAIALVAPPDGVQARVYASDDDLATFAQLGALLPQKITPLTLDAAPSDPDVLYVSALTQGTMIKGIVISSVDGGETWANILIPGSDSAEVAPFIAAVDPTNPARLWVRLNGAPGRLLLSEDYGMTFDEITQTTGFLHSFKLTPDGATAYFGGALDGLFRMDTVTFEITPLAPLTTRCVTLHDTDVLSCGDETQDGFSAGISSDGGLTFGPLLRNRCFEGILPCDDGTPVHDQCEPVWPAIQDLIGAVGDCDEQGGAGGSGGAISAGGSHAGGAPTTSTGGAPATGGNGASDGDDDGCSCSTSTGARPAWIGLLALLLVHPLRRALKSTNPRLDAPQPTSGRPDGRRRRPRTRDREAPRFPRRAPSSR